MNYTINEIPDEATDANSGDYMVMWQGKTKKVSILNLLKTLVKKSEVTNTVSASSDNVITSKGVSSLLTIPAGNTTITNAPPLQKNATYRFFFTSQITGSDDTTAMSISYNGTSYSVKATSNGSLKDFTAYPIATEQTRELKKGEKSEEEKGETKSGTRATVTTYVYCQAYTTIEMMFDGSQFIIMGNPVVISSADYTIYTDGSITYRSAKNSLIQSNTTGAIVSMQKMGKIVTLNAFITGFYIEIQADSDIVNGLPTPQETDSVFDFCGANWNSKEVLNLYISNGALRSRQNIPASTWVYFSVCYLSV